MRYELSDYEWSVIRPMLPNLAANYLAFVKLACIRLWLRFYECTAFSMLINRVQDHVLNGTAMSN